ncbi:hypothetical protein SRM_p56032 (plasmid) [Salinibacter ruber M8]|uniref:Uncharacterized protein n=1 Tax=Salinibacter ruber (strain M8) TaxID=761659 RepID=D5H4B0_SALRM|nr:hypothetical protein SRM_p56032 [Salinibacter ruber M8]
MEEISVDCRQERLISLTEASKQLLDRFRRGLSILVEGTPNEPVGKAHVNRRVAGIGDHHVREVYVPFTEQAKKNPGLPCAPVTSFPEWRVDVDD